MMVSIGGSPIAGMVFCLVKIMENPIEMDEI